MKFSLVMTTLGRFDEIKSFLESLKSQKYKKYELILVDQNDDERIGKFIESIEDQAFFKKIKYLKMKDVGISKGRNLGLKHVSGDILAFPDDDCEYPDDLLEKVKCFYQNNPRFTLLTGRCFEKVTLKRSLQRSPNRSRFIRNSNIFTTVNSNTIFIKRNDIKNLFFDEDFGINGRYGAAEDNDLVYRILKEGHWGFYNSEIIVYHPVKELGKADINIKSTDRLFKFNMGCGAFFRKNLTEKFDFLLLIHAVETILLKPMMGFMIYIFNRHRRTIFWIKLKARLKGFWNYTGN